MSEPSGFLTVAGVRGCRRLQGRHRPDILRGVQGPRPRLQDCVCPVPHGEGPGQLECIEEGLYEEGHHTGDDQEGVALGVDMS